MSRYNKNRFGSIVLTDDNGNNFTITKKEQAQIKTLVKRANTKRSYYIDKYYNQTKSNNNMKGVSKEVYQNLLTSKGFVTEKYSTTFNQFKSKADVKDFIKELKQVTKKGYNGGLNKANEIRQSMIKQVEKMYGNDAIEINDILNDVNDVDLMSLYIHNDNLIKDLYYPNESVDMFVEKMKSDINYALKKIKQ